MKTLLQYLQEADKKADAKTRAEFRDLIRQIRQKMHASGELRMKTLQRKRWT